VFQPRLEHVELGLQRDVLAVQPRRLGHRRVPRQPAHAVDRGEQAVVEAELERAEEKGKHRKWGKVRRRREVRGKIPERTDWSKPLLDEPSDPDRTTNARCSGKRPALLSTDDSRSIT